MRRIFGRSAQIVSAELVRHLIPIWFSLPSLSRFHLSFRYWNKTDLSVRR